MSLDRRFFRPLGALCILASDPIIEAGIAAAGAFARRKVTSFRLGVSVLSVLAAVLLLIAGLMLCFKRVAGGTMAVVAASLSVPVSIFGATIGLMGGHALMYGAGYPIVIVLLLTCATPSNGLPTTGDRAPDRSDTQRDNASLRAAIA
jgi:hypothetical protein